MQRRRTRSTYIAAVSAQLAGSLVSSAAAGALIGLIGTTMPVDRTRIWPVAAVLAGALFLREVEIFDFPIPQLARQTQGSWYRDFGPIRAAWLWGLDLGSGMSTFVVFSGYWVVVLGALFSSSPLEAAGILCAYGVGRSAAVVIPAISGRRRSLVDTFSSLLGERRQIRNLHAAGLVIFGLSAAVATFAKL